LSKHPEYNIIIKKKQQQKPSISTYNINNGKMNIAGSSGRVNGGKIIRDYADRVLACGLGRIDGVTALPGFSYKKMYQGFAGTKKVTVF